VLRSLGLMADMDIDELENLAQRVEIAKHQVRCPEPPIHYLLCQALLNKKCTDPCNITFCQRGGGGKHTCLLCCY